MRIVVPKKEKSRLTICDEIFPTIYKSELKSEGEKKTQFGIVFEIPVGFWSFFFFFCSFLIQKIHMEEAI